jgi:hypothetical protein
MREEDIEKENALNLIKKQKEEIENLLKLKQELENKNKIEKEEFEKKLQNQKEDFEKIIQNLKNEKEKQDLKEINEIDTSKTKLLRLSYENLILKKIHPEGFNSSPIKKISKKNCDTDENKFSIKIINTITKTMFIGISDSTKKFPSNYFLGEQPYSWGYYFSNGNKYNNKISSPFSTTTCNTNDIVSLKYNSKIGTIEIFKNGISLGIMFDNIDTSIDYFFAVSLCRIDDTIQLIQ